MNCCFVAGEILLEEGFASGTGPARGGVEVWGLSQHCFDRGVFVSARDVLNYMSDAGRLCGVHVLDESHHLNEGLAAGVFDALVHARIRVWLVGWAGDDEVYAFWE